MQNLLTRSWVASTQITHYILSDEFMNAWNVLLSQLGEFAERDAKKKQKEHKDTTASKALQAVELCKRFYYFTQHLLLNRYHLCVHNSQEFLVLFLLHGLGLK